MLQHVKLSLHNLNLYPIITLRAHTTEIYDNLNKNPDLRKDPQTMQLIHLSPKDAQEIIFIMYGNVVMNLKKIMNTNMCKNLYNTWYANMYNSTDNIVQKILLYFLSDIKRHS